MRIVVTRPAQQAQVLAEKIRAIGAEPILFPTLEIVDAEDQQLIHAQIQQLSQYNIVIFISPNAVQKAAKIIKQYWPAWPEQVKIAAIGNGTAQILRELNWPAAIYPHQQFNSEGLLVLPALQQITSKKILLIKGVGGRELLASTLRQRGAIVTELIVYSRISPKLDKLSLPDWQNIDVIVCTSSAGLQNLLEFADLQNIQKIQLLVSSERLALHAKKLGFVKSVLIADNAGDAAIVKALITLEK